MQVQTISLYNEIGSYVGYFMMFYHVVSILGFLYHATQVAYPSVKDYQLFGFLPTTLMFSDMRSKDWASAALLNAMITIVWLPLMIFLWLPFILIVPLYVAVSTARKKKFG